MPLDLPDWELGEILVDFEKDSVPCRRIKRLSQVDKRPRWRDDHQSTHSALAHKPLQRRDHFLRKTMLVDVMPIRWLHGAAPARVGAREPAAGLVGSLVMGARVIFVDEDAFDDKFCELFIALVAQK